MLFQKKRPTLTSQEKSCLTVLKDRPSNTLKLRKSGVYGSHYCIYDPAGNPICTYSRGIVDGLIVKTYIDYTKETGVFIIL